MRWHRKLKTLLPLRPIEKRNRPKHRVLLQLEELETRALLSVGSATPIQATTITTNEVVPPSTNAATNQNAFPLLKVTPQDVSAQQTPGPPTGSYTPPQIRSIYGFDQIQPVNGQTIDGAGETIAIVDAYYDPNILSDANTFSSQPGFNLPLFNSPGGPTLTVVASGGGSASSLQQDPTGGWPLETSLDVEWAHAMAPQANILLVEAPDESNTSMFNAVQYAASQPGVVVVSMSWGTNEFSGETSYDGYFQPKSSTNPSGYTTNPAVTFVAASGDSGAGAIYPAASPYVLSAGGTTLAGSTNTTGGGGFGTSGFGTSGFGTSGFGTSGFGTSGFGTSGFFARSASARPGGGLYAGSGSLRITPDATGGGGGSNPNYPGESAWSFSGGGPSAYEGYPSYQYDQTSIANTYDYSGTPPGYPPGPYNVEVTNQRTGTTNYYSARMTPDVAYNAVNYAIYDSIPSQAYGTVAGWNSVDGTSASAPQWSAIVALADQARAAAIPAAPALSTSDVLNAVYNTLGSYTDPTTDPTYTSVFHDITTGSNGYSAAPGYDLATGLGTPIVNNLVPLLANAPSGTTFTIFGSGYGGTGGAGGSSSLGGSSGFSGSSFFGFAAGAQPGGGLYAGSGSLSLAPVSQGGNGPNGQTGGASVTPQANGVQAPVANSLTFSLAPTGTATATNNFVGNISTLAPSPSTTAAGNTPAAASTIAPLGQANALLGASGWKGADLSWHLNSLDLPSPEMALPADDSSANSEDGIDGSSGDVLLSDSDSSGEDWSELDVIAPAQQDDSDAGDGGDG
jgi:hypothetical protein